MKEATLNIDSFGNNQLLEDFNGVAKQIFNLITMRKNTDPLNPDKGVDIHSYKYSIDDGDVLSKLQEIIQTQVQTYTPYLPVAINVKSKNKIIYILMALDGSNNTILIKSDGTASSFDIFKDS